MAMQSAVCPNCGGSLKVDDVDLNGFCQCEFCHTSHKILDVITIDGLPTVKSLLLHAQMQMQDGNYEKAVFSCNEILRHKPNCHEAWWCLYQCNRYYDEYYQYRDKYGNGGPLTKAAIMADTIGKYALKAIEYAPPAKKEQYRAEIQPQLDFIEAAKAGQFDQPTKQGKFGCYIATAVYGSYTCREVMLLRRYRDDCLARRAWGRLLIRVYYKISPVLAKRIAPSSFLGRGIRALLDRKVKRLSMQVSDR